jgi:hypothetical protein
MNRQLERRSFVATRWKAFVETIGPLLMLCGCTIVSARPSAMVSAVEPSKDALSMELGFISERGLLSRLCGALTPSLYKGDSLRENPRKQQSKKGEKV